MKKHLVFAVAILSVSLASIKSVAESSPVKTLRFTGKISKISLGCWSDSICKMVIDGKDIVFGAGHSRREKNEPEKWGKVSGFNLKQDKLNLYIGREAEVFTGILPGGELWLLGNEGYYIRLKPK